ncbi:MAG: hypothetical protein R3C19_07825 [Planctomycetaceae bacterium]
MYHNQAEFLSSADSPHFSTDGDSNSDIAPWTEVEAGRFMPRRVRGSCHGRALG